MPDAILTRVEVAVRPHLADPLGRKTEAHIHEVLGYDVKDVRVVRVFTIEGVGEQGIAALLDAAALHDPVLQDAFPGAAPGDFDWALEVGFKPGVTDNEGRTAAAAIALVLGQDTAQKDATAVYTAHQYRFTGALTLEQVQTIADKLLANELIQRVAIKSNAEWTASSGFEAKAARVLGAAVDTVNAIPLSTMDDASLMACSRENTLALSLEEMHAIKAYFQDPAVQADRANAGLPNDPPTPSWSAWPRPGASTASTRFSARRSTTKIRWMAPALTSTPSTRPSSKEPPPNCVNGWGRATTA